MSKRAALMGGRGLLLEGVSHFVMFGMVRVACFVDAIVGKLSFDLGLLGEEVLVS